MASAAVSLTGHIGTPDSPVRAFFLERLPDTGPVVREAAAALRAGRASAPLAAASEVNPGRAGTAVDYLLRFALSAEPCPRHASVHAGAGMLGRRISPSALSAVEEALSHVARVAAYRRTPTDAQWADLAQISLVLATFEAVYRSGMPPAIIAEMATAPTGWREWAAAICVEAEVEDVAVVGWAAADDHRWLRGTALRCNPIFKQSRALGGADADLITDDGLLIDLKSTSTNRVCSRSDVWQLCGYALADTNDEFAIRSVGLSLLRWRSEVAWPLDELLAMLAGSNVDLPATRHEFGALLESLARQRREAADRRRAARDAHPQGDAGASTSPRRAVLRRRRA